MSTILKALRRLEEEKSLGQVHNLREHVTATPSGSQVSGGLRALVLVGGALGSAAAGGIVFALFVAWSGGELPRVAAAPSVATTVVASAPAAVPDRGAEPGIERGVPGSSQRAAREPVVVAANAPTRSPVVAPPLATRRVEVSLREQTLPERGQTGSESPRPPEVRSANSASLAPSFERAAARAEAATVIAALAERASAHTRSQRADPPIEFAQDVAVMSGAATRHIDERTAGGSSSEKKSALVMELEESLPVIRRAKLPVLEVLRTSWHPQPARRRASLQVEGSEEPIRLAEGDSIGPLVLLEIQPDGVVFDHGGLQIRRKLGHHPGR